MNRLRIYLLTGVAAASFGGAARAADLIIQEPAPIAIVETTTSWDGAYVGAFAGYGWGTLNDDDDILPVVPTEFDVNGWFLGVNAGANFTVSEAIVAGIVADIAWADLNGGVDDFSYTVNWLGSLRGRLGFDGGGFLPYLTGGLAAAGATADVGDEDVSETHLGWTVGAGVELAVADNVSIDLLYRYSDYGSSDYVFTDATVPLDLNTHTIQAGVNFRF